MTSASALWRILGRSLTALVVVALLPYAWGPIYRFPEPAPFAGARLWNPYGTTSGQWLRTNLHAHGHAWGGLTSGEQPDAEVAARYRERGYAVAGVSDYHYIAAQHGVDALPAYEHGFNVGKVHQLAVGATGVDWFDFPFWQSRSNQQYVINRVKAKASLVALNHPSSRDAYGPSTLRALTGYDLVEVVNGPFSAEDGWDAALSAGRAVWAVANDDTHDLNDTRRAEAGWTMVDSPSADTAAVVDALRTGRSYAVLRTGPLQGALASRLTSVSTEGDRMTVVLAGAPSTVTFIGQDGAVRQTTLDVQQASYTFTPSDTYIRTVVDTPQATLYLNPVLRWDGSQLPAPRATMNVLATWAQRLAALALVAGVWMLLRRSRLRR